MYSVEKVPPQNYLDGPDFVGSVGGQLQGDDQVNGIMLGSGTNGTDYNFSELLPATISGYVFQDGPTIQVKQGAPIPYLPSIRTAS